MAEDFQAAICGDNWWSSSRSMLVAVGGLSPCSVAIGDLGWPSSDEFLDIKPKSATTDSDHHNNNSNMVFQDYSTLQMMSFALSSSSDHWNQSDDFLCDGGRVGESNNLNSNGIEQGDDRDIDTSSYEYPYLYHDPQLFNTTPSIHTNSNNFPTNLINDLSLSSTPNFPSNYLKKPLNSAAAAFDFTNNKPFWNNNNNNNNNNNVNSSTHHIIPNGIASLLQHNNPISQNTPLIANFKPIDSGNSEDGEEAKTKGDRNNATEAVVFKRPRIETPSPLPTFKVRKEKLGDRVTALQQLVSPFGKTDTASVLHEAIEYIKFLHDQVSVLSTPYMKSNNGIAPVQHQQACEAERAKEDLRSRGLCLVPISSTFPVTNAGTTTGDFWTPTFGGTFR